MRLGSIGTANLALAVQTPITDPGEAAGISLANANSGVYLQVTGRSLPGRPVDLDVQEVHSPNGPVEIRVMNAEQLTLDSK